MKFDYQLTEKFRSAEFVKTGVRPDRNQVIEVNPIESTERVRFLHEALISGSSVSLPTQDRLLTADDLLEILEQIQAENEAEDAKKVAAVQGRAEKLLNGMEGVGGWSFESELSSVMRIFKAHGLDTARLQEAEAQHEARKAQLKADAEAAKERQEESDEAAKASRLADKSDWIRTNGSAHLKRAHAGGFNCHRKYIEERAAVDLPGAIVDWDDNARWGDCACPSIEALDALDAAPEGSELVWLKASPEARTEEGYYDRDSFEPCEALVIRAYLGSKYDLVKIL